MHLSDITKIKKLPQKQRDYQVLIWAFKQTYGHHPELQTDTTFYPTDINETIAEIENPTYGSDIFEVDSYFDKIWMDLSYRVNAQIESEDDGDYWYEEVNDSRISLTVDKVYQTLLHQLHA